LADVDAEVDYIARDNPAAADRVADRIKRSVEQLAEHPALGRAGRVPGTRELIIPGTPYIVPYRVRENAVEILRVFHAARRWPAEI
jgi:toxin ParE1/3/4